ncbi:MAG: copper chaperone PCu(A)C [Azospirillaceae bacterium]
MSLSSLRVAAIAGACAAALALGSAAAHDYQIGDLAIAHPWSRATAPRVPNGVVYMAITNNGASADRLLGAAGDAAERMELHTHNMVDGVMQMRPVEGGIELPPGETVHLEPHGLHVMLMGLAAPLVEGERITVILTFEAAGEIAVEAAIEGPGATLDLRHDH